LDEKSVKDLVPAGFYV